MADNREVLSTTFTGQEPDLVAGESAPGEAVRGWASLEIAAGVPLSTLGEDPLGGGRITFDLTL